MTVLRERERESESTSLTRLLAVETRVASVSFYETLRAFGVGFEVGRIGFVS